MQTTRRQFIQAASGSLLLSLVGSGHTVAAEDLPLIRLNLPGPGSLAFLPLELISALGFDREMGAQLLLRFQPSGIRGLEDVLQGNADFAALGFPTLPVMHARGKDVVAFAPFAGQRHTFHVTVRKDLAKQVPNIGSLKGRTISISTGSPNSKTYQNMLMEVILAAHGVGTQQVRWLPSGHNWESYSGALLSKAADAAFCEQPFPNRLMRAGLAVSIADLNDPALRKKIPGISALRSALVAPRKTLALPETAHKAKLLVRMLRRTLVWLQTTPAATVASHAVVRSEEERSEIAAILKASPGIYSADARFLPEQISATDQFLHAAMGKAILAPAASLIDERWTQ
jgi:NitT/TauT family transport system substrate-binding protein